MKKEMTRKIFVCTILFLISLLFFVSLANFVSAQNNQIAQDAADATSGTLTGAGRAVNNFLTPFFGEKEMLTRIFFFILLFMIIYSIVPAVFHSSKWVSIVISVIVSLLALIALPVNFIEAIRTQYGAMGAAILSAIPFIIMLVFTARIPSALVARVVWIFFVAYYFALYLYMIVTTGAGWITAETIPYLFAIVAGLVIFFLIGSIRKALFYGEMGAIKESGNRIVKRGKLLHRLQAEELDEVYGDVDSAKN